MVAPEMRCVMQATRPFGAFGTLCDNVAGISGDREICKCAVERKCKFEGRHLFSLSLSLRSLSSHFAVFSLFGENRADSFRRILQFLRHIFAKLFSIGSTLRNSDVTQ